MARKRKQDDGEERVARDDSVEEPVAEPAQDAPRDLPDELVIAQHDERAPEDEPALPAPVAPSEDDLERQGFTTDEVRRLVLVSKRQEGSAESRFEEAAMRRMRFTRWLIEHGRLDEWSA
ncbi:MAG TPA: hypothetical protein VGR57_09800 [Ktedonobacterales bacterium]|nr:hypothetical protein [Ktedonobacterales bacterium]